MHESAIYEIEEEGHKHICTIHAVKIRGVPERGVILMCWFISVVYQTNPLIYGPLIYGKLDGKVIQDDKLTCLTELAEVKLEQMVARAMGMRYQTTPFLRLGGASTLHKDYSKG